MKGLERGLPGDFDLSQVRTVNDAQSLISRLPNADRGYAALGLYQKLVPRWAAHAGMLAA
jgi:hypothetical protein